MNSPWACQEWAKPARHHPVVQWDVWFKTPILCVSHSSCLHMPADTFSGVLTITGKFIFMRFLHFLSTGAGNTQIKSRTLLLQFSYYSVHDMQRAHEYYSVYSMIAYFGMNSSEYLTGISNSPSTDQLLETYWPVLPQRTLLFIWRLLMEKAKELFCYCTCI